MCRSSAGVSRSLYLTSSTAADCLSGYPSARLQNWPACSRSSVWQSIMNPASRLLCTGGAPQLRGPILPDWHPSACQEDRFRPGEVFGLAVDDDDIAISQDRFPGGIASQDPLAPDARKRHLGPPAANIVECAADRPCTRRDDNGDHLLLVVCGVITSRHDIAQD